MKIGRESQNYLLEGLPLGIGQNTMNCKTAVLDESFGQNMAGVPPMIAIQLQGIVSEAVTPLLLKISALEAMNAALVDRLTALEDENTTSAPPVNTAPEVVYLPQQAPPSPDMALLEEISQLKTDLTGLNEANESRALEIATDRRRLAALETPPSVHIQPKQRNQGDLLRALLATTGRGRMLQSTARRKMGISKSAFSRLLLTLEGTVKKEPYHRDRRQNVLILINKKS